MDSSVARACIRLLEEEPSTSNKLAFLVEFLEDPFFTMVIRAAYDCTKTYGVKKIPKHFPEESGVDWDAYTFRLLYALESREITGNIAHDKIIEELNRLNPASAELLARVLRKDLQCGINVKMINNAVPGTVMYFPYMRCSLPEQRLLDNFPWEQLVYCQVKANGMFVNVVTDKEGCSLYTRLGLEIPMENLHKLYSGINATFPAGYTVHGELRVTRAGDLLDRQTGNGVLNHVISGSGELSSFFQEEVILDVWDMVASDDNRPYSERFEALASYVCNPITSNDLINIIENVFVKSYEEAVIFYQRWRARGEEGAVIKNPNGIWRDGTSVDQIKVKPTKHCELRVISMLPGKTTGKNASTFGSLLCVSEDGELSAQVAGFTDEKRQEIYDNWDKWEVSIVCVKFTEVIKDKTGEWSLENPRFDSDRHTEKHEADTLEYIRKL
jgi:DNA ligase 1